MEKKDIKNSLMEHVCPSNLDILKMFTYKEGRLIRIESWREHETIGFYFDESDWFTVQHKPYGKVRVLGLAIVNDILYYIGEIYKLIEIDLMIIGKLSDEEIDRIMELCYNKIKS